MRTLTLTIIVATVLSMGGSRAPQQMTAERILLDSTLWGPDFPAALPVLVTLLEAGESNAYVFADRVAGASALSAETAAARAQKVRALIARPRALQPQFAKLQKPTTTAGMRIEAAELRDDDDGRHVMAVRPGAQLLAGGLTVEMIHNRLGKPEKVTEQAIQNRTERRPVILKLHIYAGGAIAFAESNFTEPGVIERVVVDLRRAAPLLTR